jgi:hypothetical protein
VALSSYSSKVPFEVDAGRRRLALIGSPVVFEAQAKDSSGARPSYEWSFGDGEVGKGKEVEHTYHYAGEYNVVLTATRSGEEAVARTKVKVIEPKITVSTASNDSVEIRNDTSYEVNLEGWALTQAGSKFIFPTNVIIDPKASLMISHKVSGFVPEMGRVSLLNGEEDEVASADQGSVLGAITAGPEMGYNEDAVQTLYSTLMQLKKYIDEFNVQPF